MAEIDPRTGKEPSAWDDRLVGEEHLRRLAAIRDEAEVALYAIFWSIPVPARLNYIARGEELPPLPTAT